MLKAVFTLDYEIHGNGEGAPLELMVEPTERMLNLFEEYGAKLTIMADVAEILRFRELRDTTGRDDCSYEPIARQLRDAICRGHDVQLHIHASYFRAVREGGRWLQNWAEYDFANLDAGRIKEIVAVGKEFLNELLKPVCRNYECVAFRAANWSMSPSANAVRALIENGFQIDTSVFKYGQRSGRVSFDYSNAESEIVPWRVSEQDICRSDARGELMEIPIYSEKRNVLSFLTPQRIYRALLSRLHPFTEGDGTSDEGRQKTHPNSKRKRSFSMLHAWKADFNQCTGRQLIGAIERAYARHKDKGSDLPFVLIGHSKLFTRFNERSLRPFLEHIAKNGKRFGFANISDFARKSNLLEVSNA